jgi:hypothetical protein
VVFANDLYFVDDVSKPENFVRITDGGKEGVVFNGVPDWLYEGARYKTFSK